MSTSSMIADMMADEIVRDIYVDNAFKKSHEEMLEKYGDIYINTIRATYWAYKLGKCFTGAIRNPSDKDVAEYFQTTLDVLMDIINSEDIDAQLQAIESL